MRKVVNTKQFLYVSPLSEDGKFHLPLPVPGIENQLRVEVQRLCTYLPVPDQSDVQYECTSHNDSPKDASSVKKMEINSEFLLSNDYCFNKYFQNLRKDNEFDSSIQKIYEGMWDEEECNPLDMFNYRTVQENQRNMINDIYNYFQSHDVVIFIEYGLHMNANARCLSMKSLKPSQPENDVRSPCYGMKNFQSCIYGFDVNFKFIVSETYPDVLNTNLWLKLTNEMSDTKQDFSINDMIRYSLLNFGGYELFRMPSTANISIKRQGYGFLIQFPELDTYLSLTVTAGRLPYVIDNLDNNEILLSDRDYEDKPNQRIVVMRKTGSLLRPEPGEYQLEVYNTLNRYFNEDRYGDNHIRGTRMIRNSWNLDLDFIFDCPLSTEPLCDMYRYGLNNMLPTYGGFSLIYWMFFETMYYVGALKYDIKNFFITPTSLMNFIAGNAFPYEVCHAMYPFHLNDKRERLNPMSYLVNPEFNTFIRLLFMVVKRNRSRSDRIKDVLRESHLVIGVDLSLGSEKLIINDKKLTSGNLQQTYFQSAEEFPNSETTIGQGSNFSVVKTRRNIVITDPFSSTVNLNTNVINPVIRFQFYGYDETLKKKKVKFDRDDKIIIKGQFQWLS